MIIPLPRRGVTVHPPCDPGRITQADMAALDELVSHYIALHFEILWDDEHTPYVAIDGLNGGLSQIVPVATQRGVEWRWVVYRFHEPEPVVIARGGSIADLCEIMPWRELRQLYRDNTTRITE